jgi:low temperature requirement protein LtrA
VRVIAAAQRRIHRRSSTSTTTPLEGSAAPEPADRHATWLELFFDLVVVVAVSELDDLIHSDARHGPDGLHITTFFTLYLAVWLVWTTFTLYSNVVADRVRYPSMFGGMAGLAMMAATVPTGVSDRADIFAATYLVTSGVGASSFTRSGQVLLSWGAASRTAGLVPWIVSFWVDDPWWKLSLWILGLLISLWFSVLSGGGDSAGTLDRLNERLSRRTERSRRGTSMPALVAAQVNVGHLGERLGLFVIIVLGEAMLQLVETLADVEDWSPNGGLGWRLLFTVVSAFGLLIALWWLNVRNGFAEDARFPPRFVLPAHFAAIAAVTTVAAGIGTAVTATYGHLPTSSAWLLCGGVSCYLAVITLLSRQRFTWRVLVTALAVALPLATAPLSPVVAPAVVVIVLLVACAGQAWNLASRVRTTPGASQNGPAGGDGAE